MYAVEFQTHITDGVIEVPELYRNQLSGSVRVIILAELLTKDAVGTTTNTDFTHLLTRLLAHPRPVLNFTPLKRDEIYERK